MSITAHCEGDYESIAFSSGERLRFKKIESASTKSVTYLPQSTDLLYFWNFPFFEFMS